MPNSAEHVGVMYLGPSYATMQRLVDVRERALGSAVLLLIVNLIDLGLGPSLAGVVHYMLAAKTLARDCVDQKD